MACGGTSNEITSSRGTGTGIGVAPALRLSPMAAAAVPPAVRISVELDEDRGTAPLSRLAAKSAQEFLLCDLTVAVNIKSIKLVVDPIDRDTM